MRCAELLVQAEAVIHYSNRLRLGGEQEKRRQQTYRGTERARGPQPGHRGLGGLEKGERRGEEGKQGGRTQALCESAKTPLQPQPPPSGAETPNQGSHTEAEFLNCHSRTPTVRLRDLGPPAQEPRQMCVGLRCAYPPGNNKEPCCYRSTWGSSSLAGGSGCLPVHVTRADRAVE